MFYWSSHVSSFKRCKASQVGPKHFTLLPGSGTDGLLCTKSSGLVFAVVLNKK